MGIGSENQDLFSGMAASSWRMKPKSTFQAQRPERSEMSKIEIQTDREPENWSLTGEKAAIFGVPMST